MNTQNFDQIAFNTKTLDFTLYISILGIQHDFEITHSKASYLIESVELSNNYRVEKEVSEAFIYYIPVIDKDKETTRQLKAINKTLKQG